MKRIVFMHTVVFEDDDAEYVKIAPSDPTKDKSDYVLIEHCVIYAINAAIIYYILSHMNEQNFLMLVLCEAICVILSMWYMYAQNVYYKQSLYILKAEAESAQNRLNKSCWWLHKHPISIKIISTLIKKIGLK